jgi:hypothetical protein
MEFSIHAWSETLNRNPQNLRASNLLSLLFLIDGLLFDVPASVQEAYAILEHSFTMYPHNQNAYYPLVAVLIILEENERATLLTQDAVALEPSVYKSAIVALVAMRLMGANEDDVRDEAFRVLDAFPNSKKDVDLVLSIDRTKKEYVLESMLFFF